MKYLKEKGMSIIEALMATAIVGVGFIAVFQMVNFSVNSINTSGESCLLYTSPSPRD